MVIIIQRILITMSVIYKVYCFSIVLKIRKLKFNIVTRIVVPMSVNLI